MQNVNYNMSESWNWLKSKNKQHCKDILKLNTIPEDIYFA